MQVVLRKTGLPLKKTLDYISAQGEDFNKAVYFFDEGRFGLQSSLCRIWAKKGSKCTKKVKQSYTSFYIYSAVAPKTGEQFSLLLPFVNTDMMQLYLNEFSQSLEEKNVVLIMDQAGWHKAKDLVVPANMDIWFLPAYSPELNPIERLWKFIKHDVLHNRLYESLKQLEKAVIACFDTLSDEQLKTLCACSYI